MNVSLPFIRLFFIGLSLLFSITYATTVLPGGFNFANSVIGISAGLGFSVLLIVSEFFVKRANLRTLNVIFLGLLVGYLLGQIINFTMDASLSFGHLAISPESKTLVQTIIFLTCIYYGMSLTAKATEGLYASIPFIRFKASSNHKKDILIDSTVLTESRIIDLAASGLLDDHIIIPRFVLRELYAMLENPDENIRSRARRAIDVFKKLEVMPTLELRYSDIDFPDITDQTIKLTQLARQLDANIMTTEVSRFQHGATEGIRIINIHMLSNALKPINGEQLSIKIQRFGKEPRQGVGYLEDGTMVVVNGGAEFIGVTIKAHVLSVKHTTSGRMIFCNVSEDFNECAAQECDSIASKNLLTV